MYGKNNMSLKKRKKKLTIRHIAGSIMISIVTENTSNEMPRQHRYQ